MSDLRIVIAADELLTRAGLAALLSAQAGVEVIGQLSGAALADELPLYRADAAVYDLGWESGAAFDRLSNAGDAGTPIVALLHDESAASVALAALRESTAYGLLLRESQPEVIVSALNAAASGLITLDPVIAGALFAAPALNVPTRSTADSPAEPLTPRELEVLQLLAQGLPNKTIALRLSISDSTVKFHVNAIMTKLNAQSRTDAVVRATRLGLILL
jgi:two-component system, NarL family, nitrate/nitrite response regulator NarL